MYIILSYQIILVKRNNIMENSRNLVHQLIDNYQIDNQNRNTMKNPPFQKTLKAWY